MWKPLAGRRGRTQWCDASARCGSKRYLCGVIRQRGLHHRHKGAKEERERTATKESGEAVSEGNVAENMTVPRKAIGKSLRLRSHAHNNDGLHGNGHTFRFINHNNRKGVASKAALKTKKAVYSSRTDGETINLSYL